MYVVSARHEIMKIHAYHLLALLTWPAIRSALNHDSFNFPAHILYSTSYRLQWFTAFTAYQNRVLCRHTSVSNVVFSAQMLGTLVYEEKLLTIVEMVNRQCLDRYYIHVMRFSLRRIWKWVSFGVSPCSLIDIEQSFRETYCFCHRPDDDYPDYAVQHPRSNHFITLIF